MTDTKETLQGSQGSDFADLSRLNTAAMTRFQESFSGNQVGCKRYGGGASLLNGRRRTELRTAAGHAKNAVTTC